MASNNGVDLVIIGTGPGGYVAAVKASQLGMKTVCIEKEARLGGVCLNVGCIPSKALLDSSEFYHMAKEQFADHGIKTGRVTLDLAVMMARKDQVVKDLTDQVQKLLEGHGVRIVKGTGRLAGPGKVEVLDEKGKVRETLETGNVLLATGSTPVQVPGLEFDGERIVTSTEALSFDAVPKHLGVVGGGYIGLELGSVWRRLGAKVTVIEMMPTIAGVMDGQMVRTLTRLLKSQGMEFKMKTKVVNAAVKGRKVNVTVHPDGGDEETLSVDRLLVAVGRRPLTKGLGLEEAGVKTDERTGAVLVNERYETSAKGVYAIGDLIPGPMLAHKASFEGIAAVECMAGKPGEVNYDCVPGVIYTWPEAASVGITEEQAKARKIPYCIGTYPFSGAGRARCMGEKDGFVKIIVQSETDRILGVHIIGPRAADMIAEAVLAMEFNAGSEDIARTIHGHPTFSEALMEAAMAARSCSIYAS